MRSGWILSDGVTRILWVGALLVFLLAEAVVIVAGLGLPKAHASLGIGQLLLTVFLIAIPGLAGIKGYYVAERLRSKFDAEQQDASFVWLSRQFLLATVFAYTAVIFVVISLTEAVR